MYTVVYINSQACFCPELLMSATFGSRVFIPAASPLAPQGSRHCFVMHCTATVPTSQALKSRLDVNCKYLWQ